MKKILRSMRKRTAPDGEAPIHIQGAANPEFRDAIRDLRQKYRKDRSEITARYGVEDNSFNMHRTGRSVTIERLRTTIDELRKKNQVLQEALDTKSEHLRQQRRKTDSARKEIQKLKHETVATLREKLARTHDQIRAIKDAERDAINRLNEYSEAYFGQSEGEFSLGIEEIRSVYLDNPPRRSMRPILKNATVQMRAGNFSTAAKELSLLTKASEIRTPKILSDLLDYFVSEIENAKCDENPPDVIVHYAVWGRRYSERFLDQCISSFLAHGNLPFLQKSRKVKILIHSDEVSARWIAQDKRLDAVRPFAEIEVLKYPDDISEVSKDCSHEDKEVSRNLNYLFLGAFQSIALAKAKKNKSTIMFLMPDNIYEEKFIEKIFDKLDSGYKVVTSQAPATNAQTVVPLVEAYRDSLGIICLESKDLSELQIDHLHPGFVSRIIKKGNSHFLPCPQHLFPRSDGFVVRSFHYHPIAVSAIALDHLSPSQYRILPIDEYFLPVLVDGINLRGTDVYLPANLQDIGIMGLADADEDGHPLVDPSDENVTLEFMAEQYRVMIEKRQLTSFERYCLGNRMILSKTPDNSITVDSAERELLAGVVGD